MTGNNIVMEQGWELAPLVINRTRGTTNHRMDKIGPQLTKGWPRSEVNLLDLDNTQVRDTSLTNIALLLPISQVLITKTTWLPGCLALYLTYGV